MPTPLVVVRAGGLRCAPLLPSALQKWQLVVVFFFLYLIAHTLPQLRMYAVFLVSNDFFVLCCLGGEMFMQM